MPKPPRIASIRKSLYGEKPEWPRDCQPISSLKAFAATVLDALQAEGLDVGLFITEIKDEAERRERDRQREWFRNMAETYANALRMPYLTAAEDDRGARSNYQLQAIHSDNMLLGIDYGGIEARIMAYRDSRAVTQSLRTIGAMMRDTTEETSALGDAFEHASRDMQYITIDSLPRSHDEMEMCSDPQVQEYRSYFTLARPPSRSDRYSDSDIRHTSKATVSRGKQGKPYKRVGKKRS